MPSFYHGRCTWLTALQAGIDVTVFEQDASPIARPRDWNFGIYWAQSRIEECLTSELTALIDTVQTDPSYRRHEGSVMPIYHGVTGERLKELDAPFAIRLNRRAWLDLLRTELDVRVSQFPARKAFPNPDYLTYLQYGKRLQSINTTEEGVTATFADGTVESGTLLIGAEGAHSVTRDWLFQASPQDAALQTVPISSFATLTRFNRDIASSLRDIHPTYCITLDPNGLFTWFAVHDCTANDPAEWVFMIVLTWPFSEVDDHIALARDGSLLLGKVSALAEPLAEPFKAMVRGIPRGTKTWYSSRMTYWPTRPWDNRGGRVTLAGDAAHALIFRESCILVWDQRNMLIRYSQ